MSYNDLNPHLEPQLSADDQRLLDVLVEAGFDRKAVGPLNAADNLRMNALASMLGLMKDYPVEDADETLVHATLARIDRHEAEIADRMSFESRQQRAGVQRGGRRIRLPDFITMAAVVLIAVSVLWPLLTSVRQNSMDLSCATNMRQLGYAFGNYAADNGGALPVVTAGPSLSWDTVRNALNLKPLLTGNYCEPEHLECPGHQHEDAGGADPSYSYRWFTPGSHIGWGTSPRMTVILGDLNPVIDPARAGRYVPPLSMSINHAGRGQNVLISDGATMWLKDPVVGGGDNIWLPKGTIELHSGDNPTDPMDVFLAH